MIELHHFDWLTDYHSLPHYPIIGPTECVDQSPVNFWWQLYYFCTATVQVYVNVTLASTEFANLKPQTTTVAKHIFPWMPWSMTILLKSAGSLLSIEYNYSELQANVTWPILLHDPNCNYRVVYNGVLSLWRHIGSTSIADNITTSSRPHYHLTCQRRLSRWSSYGVTRCSC